MVFATEEPNTVADNIWQLVSANLAARDNRPATSSEPASVKEIIEHRPLPARPVEQTSQASKNTGPSLENISGLCLQRLETSRLITCEQSPGTGAKYHVPLSLKPSIQKHYLEAMDAIYEMHTKISQKLNSKAQDAAASVLPLATNSNASISASDEAVESMIIRLLSDELPEARQAGKNLLEQTQNGLSNLEEMQTKVAHKTSTTEAVRSSTRANSSSSTRPPSRAPSLSTASPRSRLTRERGCCWSAIGRNSSRSTQEGRSPSWPPPVPTPPS